MSTLITDVRSLLDVAAADADQTTRKRLNRAAGSLAGPLRVGLVGRMKAGKSTLLNAIVGDRVAPTDATECTRVITEYRHGDSYRASASLVNGSTQLLRFDRTDRGAVIDLGAHRPDEISRIEVEFPSPRLRDVVLVDTPGTTSLDRRVAAAGASIAAVRSVDLDIDVVISVMRQLDPLDVDFLEAFRTPGLRPLGAINAIAVLARADEVGGGGPAAMSDARAMARSWQLLPALRQAVAGVAPVAALLAESASTIGEADYRMLAGLAEGLGVGDASALDTVDHFRRDPRLTLDPGDRERLVAQLGWHGLLASLRWVRLGLVDSSTAFVERLATHSGIDDVRRWVFGTLVDRRAALKAQRAMDLLDDLAVSRGGSSSSLRGALERVRANAHELAELQALNRLRSDDGLDISPEQRAALWRVLGGSGTSDDERLATNDVVRSASAALDQWRYIAGDAMSSPDLQWLARLAVQSLASLAETATASTGGP